jgi:hypothetical protein
LDVKPVADVAGNALVVGANTTWQTVAPFPADFNLDGAVNLSDLNIWKANFGIGTTRATEAEKDASG